MIDLDAARAFVHGHARLLDRRRFQHAFDGAPAELVLAALNAYRNPDGGIGALEPDLRTPASQPIPARYALEILATVPPSNPSQTLALGTLDWLVTVTNADGGVPFVLPSAAEQPAAVWLRPSSESSLLATAQLTAAALRLGLDHPWLAGAAAYCWARVHDVSPGDAYTFKYIVDFLDVTPDRARAGQEIDRLAKLVPADGRIIVGGGIEGEELDPLVIAPWPEHAGAGLFDSAVLPNGRDTGMLHEQPLQTARGNARPRAQLVQPSHTAVGLGQPGHCGDLPGGSRPRGFHLLLEAGAQHRHAGCLAGLRATRRSNSASSRLKAAPSGTTLLVNSAAEVLRNAPRPPGVVMAATAHPRPRRRRVLRPRATPLRRASMGGFWSAPGSALPDPAAVRAAGRRRAGPASP